MLSFTDFDLEGFQDLLRRWGQKPVQARKLFRAYYDNGGRWDWDQLQLGNELRRRVEAEIAERQSSILRRVISADGTLKLLVGFAGGGAVESVLMPAYRLDRAAACISSQIGCAMGCDFCASTKAGLERNLSAGEITEQYIHLRNEAAAMNRRLTSLVFMGMGEPLLNLDNVLGGIRRIADPDMGALGWRQVTVSTVGIVPGIEKLADADLNVHLALSLHAPNDATRAKIVPMARHYTISEIIDAAKRFHQRTRRIVTIEYCLLAGINDSDEQAEMLAALLSGFRAHVNLIAYNPIGVGLSGRSYSRPPPQRTSRFLEILRARGTVAHRRDIRGDDVNAACGQLRESASSDGELPGHSLDRRVMIKLDATDRRTR